MVLSLVRKASTLAPLQCAKHATLPKVMPAALIFSKGSQQSSIESSNHLQGPAIETPQVHNMKNPRPAGRSHELGINNANNCHNLEFLSTRKQFSKNM